MTDQPKGTFTRREYLILRTLVESGPGDHPGVFLAMEAVDSTALAHPEWDMNERKTFDEWAAQP